MSSDRGGTAARATLAGFAGAVSAGPLAGLAVFVLGMLVAPTNASVESGGVRCGMPGVMAAMLVVLVSLVIAVLCTVAGGLIAASSAAAGSTLAKSTVLGTLAGGTGVGIVFVLLVGALVEWDLRVSDWPLVATGFVAGAVGGAIAAGVGKLIGKWMKPAYPRGYQIPTGHGHLA